jgi:uncharacterized protein (DUF2336 family)
MLPRGTLVEPVLNHFCHDRARGRQPLTIQYRFAKCCPAVGAESSKLVWPREGGTRTDFSSCVAIAEMTVHTNLSLLDELDRAILTGSPEKRQRALWAATDMLMVGQYTEEEIWVFGEVIGRLAAEIEFAARARLSEKLSRVDHAPLQVIGKFAADDAIEIAGPVLQYSQRLDVPTLVDHAKTKGQPHLLAISRRRSLPEPVTEALVARGNRAVARSVTANRGARFSEASFLNLIKRSENDSILAERLGLRNDIPRHLFHQLIAKASDETRKKLEGERPDMMDDVDALVADVTASLHSKFGPASPHYFAAKKRVSAKHRIGELAEQSILEYALAHKIEETIVGLALLCSMSSDVVERALTGSSKELLLILCKANDFSWETTTALLFLGARDFRMSGHEFDDLKDQFARLHVSSSRDVLSHYRSRRAATTNVKTRHLPEPPGV